MEYTPNEKLAFNLPVPKAGSIVSEDVEVEWPFNNLGKSLDNLLKQKKFILTDSFFLDEREGGMVSIGRFYESPDGNISVQLRQRVYIPDQEKPSRVHCHFSSEELEWKDNVPYFATQTLLEKLRIPEANQEINIDFKAHGMVEMMVYPAPEENHTCFRLEENIPEFTDYVKGILGNKFKDQTPMRNSTWNPNDGRFTYQFTLEPADADEVLQIAVKLLDYQNTNSKETSQI